jgi:hypothetical protein
MITENRSTTANIGFAKAGVTCIYDSLVLNQSAVLRLKIGAKKPAFAKPETVMRHPMNDQT